MEKNKWFVIVNPAAGGYKVKKRWPEISKALSLAGLDFESCLTKDSLHAVQTVANAVTDGFRKIIVVGGDGTLNLTINGIFDQKSVNPSNICVGIIPVGTGNDWIRTQMIPRPIEKSIQVIVKGKTVLHDIGRLRLIRNSSVEVHYFINMAGFGFDGFVAERIEGVSSNLKKGSLAFVLGIFDALFRYRQRDMRIQMDEEKMEGIIFNVNVGICKYAGGGMKVTPDAVFDDGKFDITIVRKIGKPEVILNVTKLFNGSFVHNKKVSRYRAAQISISSPFPIPIETDGEVLGYGISEIDIIGKAIQVVVP